MTGSRRDEGFSLIEVLVVLVIIAILAAIAIPIFVRQREKAWLAQVESTLEDAATSMEAWATEAENRSTGYADATVSGLEEDEGLRVPVTVDLRIAQQAQRNYCLEADHDDLPGTYFLENGEQVPLIGTCPAP